jgi:hypothetical protein
LLVGAEAHDTLHPGAIVPAAIEEHQFLLRREVRRIPLEIPGGIIPL